MALVLAPPACRSWPAADRRRLFPAGAAQVVVWGYVVYGCSVCDDAERTRGLGGRSLARRGDDAWAPLLWHLCCTPVPPRLADPCA